MPEEYPSSLRVLRAFDATQLAMSDFALHEYEPGLWNVVKNRLGRHEKGINWLRRQTLLDEVVSAFYHPRVMEKRYPMPLDSLSGSRVAHDENAARQAYPFVTWAHPQLYPGIMVPNWAVALRDACTRVGLAGFGRALLQYVSRMFPPQNREEERKGAFSECDDEEEARELERRFEEEDRADLEKERKALEAVKAAIAVLDTASERMAQDVLPGRAQNEREALAMQVIDVLELGGLRYNTHGARGGSFRKDLPKAERERINEEGSRSEAVSKLLVSTRRFSPELE